MLLLLEELLGWGGRRVSLKSHQPPPPFILPRRALASLSHQQAQLLLIPKSCFSLIIHFGGRKITL